MADGVGPVTVRRNSQFVGQSLAVNPPAVVNSDFLRDLVFHRYRWSSVVDFPPVVESVVIGGGFWLETVP